MAVKKPPTSGAGVPYKQPMELVYSEERSRQETAGLSDRELAGRAASGYAVAFEARVVRKSPAVLWIARRVL